MPEFTWRPANEALTGDVQAVFDTGGARKCRCQALKVPGWIWRDTTQDQRDAALLEQTNCGTDGPTSGLIGYLDGVPAGWVAVEPRENYPRVWSRQKSWMRMNPELVGVWSVTCFVVGKDFRKLGLMYELAAATVEYGRQVDAQVDRTAEHVIGSEPDPLVHQGRDRDLPAVPWRTQSIGIRDADVGEIDLVELRVPGHLPVAAPRLPRHAGRGRSR